MSGSDRSVRSVRTWARASDGQTRPEVYRRRSFLPIVGFVVAVVLYRSFRTEGFAQESLFNDWLTYAIVAIGFYFVFGLSGQFAFSQAALFGLGGYASAWATHNPSHPFLFGPLAAVVVCLLVAAVFSFIMQRTARFYFAVGTLGLQSIILLIVTKWRGFSHAAGGEALNIRPISVLGHEMTSEYDVFKVLVVLLAAVLLTAALIERSPVRRESIANRDKPIVARTLGLPWLENRIAMFMLGTFFAALAGSVYAHRNSSIAPESFGVGLGLSIFLMVMLGGLRSPWGAVLGSWFYVYANDKITQSGLKIGSHALREFRTIIFGALLILVIIALPEGLVGIGARARPLLRRPWRRAARPLEADSGAAPVSALGASLTEANAALRRTPVVGNGAAPDAQVVIDARDISVDFGGVRAVDEVSVALQHGQILGVVGPNGSGKSTFLNALTGLVPAHGRLVVLGRRQRLGRPGAVRHIGVLRTYQTPQTVPTLSCIDNVLLTTTDRRLHGILASIVLRPFMLRHERQRWHEAAAALARVGLLERADDLAANLSYGQQRMLELARTIAGRPAVVLLDEPSAGLNDAETQALSGHLQQLRDSGVALLLVDHKIDFVNSLCDHVVVFELGRVIARGSPDDIWADARVKAAYLGTTDERPTAPARPRREPLPAAGDTVLGIADLAVSYGAVEAVRGVSLQVRQGEIVALLGPNGAGKTSTLRAVSALERYRGKVWFEGVDVAALGVSGCARRGLIHVPEGRHVFPTLSVHENLQLGEIAAAGRPARYGRDDVYDLFPPLAKMRHRAGWALSGGEQQMVAIGRALVASPRMLLLDEPSLGLAPVIVQAVFAALAEVGKDTPMLLVEQNTAQALSIADRGVVLVNGHIVAEGSAAELGDRDALMHDYLGRSESALSNR